MKNQSNIVNFEFSDDGITLTEAVTESFHLFLKHTLSSYHMNIDRNFPEESQCTPQ